MTFTSFGKKTENFHTFNGKTSSTFGNKSSKLGSPIICVTFDIRLQAFGICNVSGAL